VFSRHCENSKEFEAICELGHAFQFSKQKDCFFVPHRNDVSEEISVSKQKIASSYVIAMT